MKPYQQISIYESGEPLVPIPVAEFAVEQPHPYVRLGAPYGSKSPYYLRQTVLDKLRLAQTRLQQEKPGWQIQIFDAYRPIAVQQFMVDYSLRQMAEATGLNPNQLTEAQRHTLLEQVHQFWATPSANPQTPPPHSTGAAVDITLIDAAGGVVDMGSPIDEMSPRSYPNYYAQPHNSEADQFHAHRQLLQRIMLQAGFEQHPQEWWHFSSGDQLWAWLTQQKQSDQTIHACYGACL